MSYIETLIEKCPLLVGLFSAFCAVYTVATVANIVLIVQKIKLLREQLRRGR